MGGSNSHGKWEKPESWGKHVRPLKAASLICHDTSIQIPLAKAFHVVKPQVNGEVNCFRSQITWQWAWIIIILQEGGGMANRKQ